MNTYTSRSNVYLDLFRIDVDLSPHIDRMFFINETLEDMALEDGFSELSETAPAREHARRVLTRYAAALEDTT